ncbi:MAG TPA: hypothetical protein PKH93_00220 [Chitinophagales bacterium]|nr:hypothetical protein [Chitinophagales bacterium]
MHQQKEKGMYNSKLLQIIKQLSDDDLKRFAQFLQSPYLNSNQNAIALFEIIYFAKPSYDSPSLNRHYVFAQLFPNAPQNGTNLSQLMTELLRLLRKFLALEHYYKNPQYEHIYLLNELLQRNQSDLLEPLLQQSLPSMPQDEDNLYHQYKLLQVAFSWSIRTRNRETNQYLTQWLDATDSYFMFVKTRQMAAVLNRQGVLNSSYQIRFDEAIAQYIEQDTFENNILLQLYYKMAMMLKNPDDIELYQRFRNDLKQVTNEIHIGELMQFYSLCLNQENKFIKNRVKDSYQDLYHLAVEMADKGFFNQYISNVLFSNIVRYATEVGEFEWAKKFMDKYKKKIAVHNDEEKELIYQYSLAIWYFKQQQYRKAKQAIGMKYPDALFYLDRKVLLIKILYWQDRERFIYDTKTAEEFANEIKAVQSYLRRDTQIANFNKEAARNFIKYARKLFDYQQKVLESKPKVSLKLQDDIIAFCDKMTHIQPLQENVWLSQTSQELLSFATSSNSKRLNH